MARVIIDAEKWQMSKEQARSYGDKVTAEVSGPNGGPLEVATVDKLELARWCALLLTKAVDGQLEIAP